MTKKELLDRTNNFAHACVKLAINLPTNKLSSHIQGQLIRCSTSVAANYRAVIIAQTKAPFISKLSVVIEEADESYFGLEFALDENLIDLDRVKVLRILSKKLTSIFISSRKRLQTT